jgi:hypothetical protein
MQELEAENAKLKRMCAELALENPAIEHGHRGRPPAKAVGPAAHTAADSREAAE